MDSGSTEPRSKCRAARVLWLFKPGRIVIREGMRGKTTGWCLVMIVGMAAWVGCDRGDTAPPSNPPKSPPQTPAPPPPAPTPKAVSVIVPPAR